MVNLFNYELIYSGIKIGEAFMISTKFWKSPKYLNVEIAESWVRTTYIYTFQAKYWSCPTLNNQNVKNFY